MSDLRTYPSRNYFRAEATVMLTCCASGCHRDINRGEIYVSDGHSYYHGRCTPRVVSVDLTVDDE